MRFNPTVMLALLANVSAGFSPGLRIYKGVVEEGPSSTIKFSFKVPGGGSINFKPGNTTSTDRHGKIKWTIDQDGLSNLEGMYETDCPGESYISRQIHASLKLCPWQPEGKGKEKPATGCGRFTEEEVYRTENCLSQARRGKHTSGTIESMRQQLIFGKPRKEGMEKSGERSEVKIELR